MHSDIVKITHGLRMYDSKMKKKCRKQIREEQQSANIEGWSIATAIVVVDTGWNVRAPLQRSWSSVGVPTVYNWRAFLGFYTNAYIYQRYLLINFQKLCLQKLKNTCFPPITIFYIITFILYKGN